MKKKYAISDQHLKDADIMNHQKEAFKENVAKLIDNNSDNQLVADILVDLFNQNAEILSRLAKVEYYTTK